MNSRNAFLLFAFLLIAVAGIVPVAHSAGKKVDIPEKEWSFDGVFGSFDRGALQRGYKVYAEVCKNCHSLKYLYYRNLMQLGYTEDEVKAIASQFSVMDGPNDEGEMFERPAKPSDHFVSPFPNRKAAEFANGGAYPPDMTLISKARKGGADYIYALLVGYEEPPEEMKDKLLTGQYYNKYMSGHIIAMAAPLADGMIAYEDGSPETLEQYSEDVATFLAWTAEPTMEVRKKTGLKVFIFLLAFAGIMYATKRKVWLDKH